MEFSKMTSLLLSHSTHFYRDTMGQWDVSHQAARSILPPLDFGPGLVTGWPQVYGESNTMLFSSPISKRPEFPLNNYIRTLSCHVSYPTAPMLYGSPKYHLQKDHMEKLRHCTKMKWCSSQSQCSSSSLSLTAISYKTSCQTTFWIPDLPEPWETIKWVLFDVTLFWNYFLRRNRETGKIWESINTRERNLS